MLSDPSILDSETDVTFMMSKSHKNNFASPIRSPESSGCSRTITLQLRIPTDQEKSHMGDPGASTLVSVTDQVKSTVILYGEKGSHGLK